MPAPISSASPNGAVGPAAQRLGELRAHLLLADRAEVDPPLGVVVVGRRVVVAGVDVLDPLRRWRSASAGIGAGLVAARGAQHYGPAPWTRRPPAAKPAPRRAAAGADRRAHAARRARGELLVPAPPRRLRVDRASGSAGCGSSTSPAARATAPTCSPDAPPRWSASTPTRRPTSTPGCATGAPNLRFERDLVESSTSRCDAIVFLQTIEHVERARTSCWRASPRLAPRRLRLDAEPAHARPAGRREVRQPLAPARVHGRRVPRAARARTSRGSSCSASSTPASCALHELALAARLGPRPPGARGSPSPSTTASSRRSRAADFALRREAEATSTARSTSSRSAGHDRRPAAASATLRIVLHSPHALRRGLRHLAVRRGVAVRRGGPLLPAGARGRRAT